MPARPTKGPTESEARQRILDSLQANAVRRDELAGRLHLDDAFVHRTAKRLADEQVIHSDGRYWILGAKPARRRGRSSGARRPGALRAARHIR